jgi:sulfur relay (sulfurtransferase) complex TusBCD TusD component (DsrE family)
MKITVIVQTDPYKYRDLETAYAIITAALEKEHEVKVFLYDESVIAASRDVKANGEKRQAEIVRSLVEKGVEVTTCSACCILRGIAKEALVKGSQMGGLPDLARMTSWADRLLNFSN